MTRGDMDRIGLAFQAALDRPSDLDFDSPASVIVEW